MCTADAESESGSSDFGPHRASACSTVPQFNTALRIGTSVATRPSQYRYSQTEEGSLYAPVSSWACIRPCATDSEIYSKWKVSPLMRTPKAIITETSSGLRVRAIRLQAQGSSNAPGTTPVYILFALTPAAINWALVWPTKCNEVSFFWKLQKINY